MYELGSRIERKHQFPVKISTVGKIDNYKVEWTRSLNKENGRITNIGARYYPFEYLDKEKIKENLIMMLKMN